MGKILEKQIRSNTICDCSFAKSVPTSYCSVFDAYNI